MERVEWLLLLCVGAHRRTNFDDSTGFSPTEIKLDDATGFSTTEINTEVTEDRQLMNSYLSQLLEIATGHIQQPCCYTAT